MDLVDDRGRGGDQVEIVFAFQPVTDDLKVQQAKEAAAKAKAERGGGFHFKAEGGVVERQLLDRVAQVFEFGGIDRKEAAEDHRLRGFETGKRRGAGFLFMRDRVADAGVADLLDGTGEDADLSGAEFLDIDHLGFQHGELVDPVNGAGLHHLDAVALADDAVHDADQDDDAKVGVVPAVDQHRLERRIAVALGGRQPGDDGFEHVGDADAGLGADFDGLAGVDADDILDLGLDLFHLGGGQVDLVQDRDDFVVGVDRLIDVGQRLRLDPLGGVDDQQRAFDRAHGAGNLVAEIDMAGGVDEVQDIGLAVLRRVFDPDGVGLDGDAALALDIHAVEHLGLHVAFGDCARQLDQPVGKRGFAVVDMGHDGEIADVFELGHDWPDMMGISGSVKRALSAILPAGRHLWRFCGGDGGILAPRTLAHCREAIGLEHIGAQVPALIGRAGGVNRGKGGQYLAVAAHLFLNS